MTPTEVTERLPSLSHAAGRTDRPLLDETIGHNLERTVAAHEDPDSTRDQTDSGCVQVQQATASRTRPRARRTDEAGA